MSSYHYRKFLLWRLDDLATVLSPQGDFPCWEDHILYRIKAHDINICIIHSRGTWMCLYWAWSGLHWNVFLATRRIYLPLFGDTRVFQLFSIGIYKYCTYFHTMQQITVKKIKVSQTFLFVLAVKFVIAVWMIYYHIKFRYLSATQIVYLAFYFIFPEMQHATKLLFRWKYLYNNVLCFLLETNFAVMILIAIACLCMHEASFKTFNQANFQISNYCLRNTRPLIDGLVQELVQECSNSSA